MNREVIRASSAQQVECYSLEGLHRYYRKSGYDVPDDVWSRVVDQNVDTVNQACARGEKGQAARTELLKAIFRELSETYHSHPGKAESHQEEASYDASDLLYIRSLSEWFAARAAESPLVRSFREEVLGGSDVTTEGIRSAARLHHVPVEEEWQRIAAEGKLPRERLLTGDEAEAFLNSPATRLLSLEQFREWRIPVIGHTAVQGTRRIFYDLDDFGKHTGRSESLEITPPGDTFVVRAPVHSLTIDGYRLVHGRHGPDYPVRVGCDTSEEAALAAMIRTDWQGGKWKETLSAEERTRMAKVEKYVEARAAFLPTQRSFSLHFERELLFWTKDGYERKVRDIWPGSLLDRLLTISQSLAKSYHWREADATMFVLTGAMPYVQAFHATTTTVGGGYFTDAYVDIKVLPWVSWQTVHAVYRDAQRRLLGKNAKRDERTLEVFRFVTRQAGTHIERDDPRWPELYEKWTAEHPREQKPFKHPCKLWQSYNRARNSLLRQEYTKRVHEYEAGQQESLRQAEEARRENDLAAAYKKALADAKTPEERAKIKRMLRELEIEPPKAESQS